MLSWIHVIEWRATATPHLTALSDDRGQELSYRELADAVEKASGRLAAAGVGDGDTVALLARNRVDWFVVLLAAVRAGALPAALNWRLAPAEISELLALLSPSVVIADADTATLVGDTVSARRISLDPADRSGWIDLVAFDGPPPPRPVSRLRGTQPCVLLHTSGTTGRPKLVPITHQMLVAAAVFMQLSVPEAVPGVRHLTVLPLFHLAGLANVAYCLFTGGRMRVLGGFEPARFLDEVAQQRIALTNLVPAAIRRVVDEMHARSTVPDLSSLLEIAYGASPIDPGLLRVATDTLGCRFRQHYATTETGCLPVTSLPPEDHAPELERLATAGVPSLGWEVRIADADGMALPSGRAGEIQVRGPWEPPGYWRDRQASTEAVTGDGYYRTGDVGMLDADGYLTIVDRIKDMVVTGGENVYPAEVEAVLIEHPAVSEVSVIGRPDDRWGETVHAIVVPSAEDSIDSDGLLRWMRGRLAGFKCPNGVTVVASLPRNATGKVLKNKLREPFWRDRARRVS